MSDFGLAGPLTSDITSDTLPSYVLENTDRFPAHRVEIPHLWTGWKSRSEEIRRLTTEWIPGLWPTLRRLRWRDAYSIHFTALQTWYDPPTGDLDTILTRQRLLDTNEIIRDVTAWGREYRQFAHDTGFYFTRPDSATNTFVEVGLFDRLPGPNGYDTNAIMIVNRRTFERSAVVPRTSARGRIMDSLAEVRQIRFHLNNLHHPDTSHQYTWFRIVEVGADQTPIPVMSPGVEVARTGLDTILHVDSLVSLTLRPAGSALLMIFPVGPDTTISTGDLAYNNSRKVVFDGVRYHCVYMRKNDTLGPSEVFYRRSVPVSDENNAILWEPVEYSVSRSNGTDNQRTRTHNRTPSITFRTIDGNTYLTVTWSCEPFPAMSSTVREICQRTFRADDFGPQFGPIQTISLYQGSEDSEYGTPVVSRLDGRGYVVAWSDSLDGIVARLARLQALDPSLLNDTLLLSPRHLVSANLPQAAAGPLRCLYPTMPPFSHIAALDSNVGIAFEARILGQQNIDIVYKRLWWQADTLLSNNYTKLNSFAGQHRHPSMDLWQDFNNHAYEGVVWEEIVHDALKNNDYTNIWFQPLATRAERYDTNAPNNFSIHWDNPDSTTTWQWTKVHWMGTQREKQAPGYGWPSTAALNEVTDYVNQFDTGHFAIVWVDTTAYDGTSETEDSTSVHTMRSTKVYFGNAELVPGYPHDYMFDGYQPTHVASTVRQDLQSGVLYNTGRLNDSASVMRTSRQFFGKARPTGYVAQGRSLVIRLNDSTATGLRVEMSNAWYADDTVAQGLRLSARGPSSQSIDSMAQVRSLFRTVEFTTHDSVTVGVDIKADFAGDSTLAGGAEITCTVQLIDSATDDVVEVLGSFTISAADTAYSASLESDLDLLSGSYYIRLAIDTSGITPVPSSVGSLYPVDEMYRCVGDHELLGKVRRLQGSGGGAARLDIRPNPSIGLVEIRFSIPTTSRVTVHVVDQRGVDVLIPVQATMMESGRYAVALDGSRLAPGVYLVELRSGKERVVEKMVIAR